MKKFFVKLLAVMLVCLFAVSGFNFSIIADNSADHGEKLAAMNIEVSGKISLMFYFTQMENVEYLTVNVPNKDGSSSTTTVDKSDLTIDAKGRYLLKVPLAAAQQADKVTVVTYNSSDVAGKSRSYSVKDYADILFAAAGTNSKLQPAAKAVEAMLNYGAMAQTYFNYNTSNLANNGLFYRGTNPVDDMSYEDLYGIIASEESGAQGEGKIAFTSVNAYLEDSLSLRFYFEYSGSTDFKDLTVQIDGAAYPGQVLTDEQGKHYILVNQIPATLFNKQYEVLVSDGPSYAVVKYSVLNYIQARLAKTDDQAFMDVAYSMFQFYGWTNEYQNNPVISGSAQIAACSHERTHINGGTKAVLCSDCGYQTGTAGSFSIDGSGTVTSGEGFSYTVSGGEFEVSGDNGLKMAFGETMTLSGTSITSTVNENHFAIEYYATAPVKITMNYTLTGRTSSYGSDKTYSHAETYYLEAGENVFKAFEYSALDSRTSYYGYNRVTSFALQNIQVTPLTEEGADFVMFKYTADSKSVSFSTFPNSGVSSITEKMLYTQNSYYKLGVSITYGGALSELYDLTAGTSTSDSTNGKITSSSNLINRYDTGRLIQQSYYGTMGETDSYVPRYYNVAGNICKWNYNPVQGGDMSQNRARLIDYEVVDGKYIYIKVQPRDWACQDDQGNELNDGGRFTFCYMENRYTLVSDNTGNYVQVDNRMVDFSDYEHPYTHQELPAFYTMSYFDDFYWYNGTNPWTNDTYKVEDGLPFWGDAANATRTTFNFQVCNTETWGAYVNQTNKYGFGMYVPNIDVMKGGISDGEGSTDEMGVPISYFTAMKVFKIVAFEPVEYSYLLCAGHIDTIRATFTNNKDFSSNYSLNKNSISQKMPNEQDMTSIDFSVEDNLLFLQAIIDMKPSYDANEQAAKITTTGVDSYFHINYDLYGDTYTADNYSCIEIEYMIPANKTLYPTGVSAGQELYYQLGSNTVASGNYRVGNPVTLIADGKYHTAKIYTANIPNWTGKINSLRFDFLNNGIGAGQVIYLKSFSLTNVTENNPNQSAVNALNVGVCGSALASLFTDGQVDYNHIFLSPFVYNDDFVRVVNSDTTGDVGFGFTLGGGTAYGQYLVMKYRTTTPAKAGSFSIFATTNSTTHRAESHFTTNGVVGDGRWHILVVDLSASADFTASLGKYFTNEIRIDFFDAFPTGTTIDFAYIGVCDNVSKIALGDNEYIEYSTPIWQTSVDSVTMDGFKASGSSTNYAIGATQGATLKGSVWSLGGWVAVDGQTISDVSYCVTDEAGVEHWTTVTKDGAGSNRWYEDSGITSHVINNSGYGAATKGYRFYPTANLSEFVGQTVTVSVRVVTGDGSAVTVYAAKVKVSLPAWSGLDKSYAGDTLYSEMFGAGWDSLPESAVTLNGDGTVSVTVPAANSYIGFCPGGTEATGQYFVVKYKTNAIPTAGRFSTYVTSGSTAIKDDNDRFLSDSIVGDGAWHTLVIDLSKSASVSPAGDGKYYINQLRFDMLFQFAVGSVVDFKYAGFCDKLSDISADDGEYIEYGWTKWMSSIDGVTVDGTDVTSQKSTCNSEAGATQQNILAGSNSFVMNGWTAVNGQSITNLELRITDDAGTERIIPMTYNETSTNNAWRATDEITNHVVGSGYDAATVGYRFYISTDLTSFGGQMITISVRAITSSGEAVIVYAVKVNVDGEFNPNWHLSIDQIYFAQDMTYAELLDIGGSSNVNTPTHLNQSTGNVIDLSTYDGADHTTKGAVWFTFGWVAVDGYSLSSWSCNIYEGDTLLTSWDVGTLTVAEDGVQAWVANAGYSSSTVGYRLPAAYEPGLIDLSAYSGKTVTIVYSVTVDNANSNTVDILSVDVIVP